MNKGKERKKREGKQKKGVGIGVKIVALLLLLAVAALSCMGVLVQTLQSVIVTNDEIVAGQVAEQEKISELSRQFTYINGQVLTHVMTTNSVTMENLSDKILQEITDMEQQMTEFEGLLSEGDARREAFDSASAELAKYKKTVESLLVTSAENKTQAYVSTSSSTCFVAFFTGPMTHSRSPSMITITTTSNAILATEMIPGTLAALCSICPWACSISCAVISSIRFM